MRHPKPYVIALLFVVLILVLSFQPAFAANSAKQGVTYYRSKDEYPSYLHLLGPSDQALVAEAQANIEKYRKSDVTITVLDENGRPVEGAEVVFNQTDHNFLFGYQDQQPFGCLDLMKQAGFNLFVVTPHWWSQTPAHVIEPEPGVFRWPFLVESLESVRNLGFRIMVHPVVAYDPVLNPPWLRELSPSQVENETLRYVSELARKIPYATIYGLSNEANWNWGRDGLTIDQYINMIKQAALIIRAVQTNATLTVNTNDTFGDAGPTGPLTYEYPNVGPYEWYELLISRGVMFDSIAVQFRPGYFVSAEPYPDNHRVLELTEVSEQFDRFAGLGKRVQIAEFVVPSRQLPEMNRYGQLDWSDSVQAGYAEGFYTLIFSKPNAESIVWWFIQSTYQAFDAEIGPLPFEWTEHGLIPKPSYYVLKDLITNRWSTRGSGLTDGDGKVRFRGFGGNYTLTLTYKEVTKQAAIHVEDGESSLHEIIFYTSQRLTSQTPFVTFETLLVLALVSGVIVFAVVLRLRRPNEARRSSME